MLLKNKSNHARLLGLSAILLFIIGLPFLQFSLAQAIGKLEIKQITPNAFVFTTWKNLGDIVFPANGMYVIGDSEVAMVDCPWDSTQWQPLLDSIWIKHQKRVSLVVATHFHDDRTGGFDYYKRLGIKTFSSQKTMDLCLKRGEKQALFTFSKDTVFSLGPQKLEIFYPGPGHTPDNVVVWFGEEQVLFGGCFIKSQESQGLGNLQDANTKAWNVSLRKLKRKFPEVKIIIPGHQKWGGKELYDHNKKLIRKGV